MVSRISQTHPAVDRLKSLAKEKKTNHFVLLTEILENMQKERNAPFLTHLTKDYYLSAFSCYSSASSRG